jgi:hypothetical protein
MSINLRWLWKDILIYLNKLNQPLPELNYHVKFVSVDFVYSCYCVQGPYPQFDRKDFKMKRYDDENTKTIHIRDDNYRIFVFASSFLFHHIFCVYPFLSLSLVLSPFCLFAFSSSYVGVLHIRCMSV